MNSLPHLNRTSVVGKISPFDRKPPKFAFRMKQAKYIVPVHRLAFLNKLVDGFRLEGRTALFLPRLVAIPYCSSLSFPIWPPLVETSRLGDISSMRRS
jgi:hypothetical protein